VAAAVVWLGGMEALLLVRGGRASSTGSLLTRMLLATESGLADIVFKQVINYLMVEIVHGNQFHYRMQDRAVDC